MASTIPTCRAYDPAFGYELATIVAHGVARMLDAQCDEFYYLTVMNENYLQPALPAGVDRLEDGILRGLYRLPDAAVDATTTATAAGPTRVRLLGSGTILLEVIAAANLLAHDFGIRAEVWSATSYTELAREAREVQRANRLHPQSPPARSHVAACLAGTLPVVAATDYVRALPQLIAEYVEAPYTTLGTDGFGRSDTRVALRRFFEVDRQHIALTALDALARSGAVDPELPAQAIGRYGLAADAVAPWRL